MSTDAPDETWESFTRGIVARWAAGHGQDAFLRLGQLASRSAPDGGEVLRDAPPRWLTHDVDDAPFGGPANLAWLMTAFALLGGGLGLRDDQLDLALARAATAAARARTSLRALAAPFAQARPGEAVEPLAALLLGRSRRALDALDAARLEVTLGDLLALYPDVVRTPAWLAFELAATDAVRGRMHLRDEARAAAVTEALSAALDRQPDDVRRGALGLRALRGALQVWRAEARFGTERHAEALVALEAAAAVYDDLPEVSDLPRAQVPLLRGQQALREGRPDLAARRFAEALVYLTESFQGPLQMVTRAFHDLIPAALAAGELDVAEDALTRARRSVGRDGAGRSAVVRKLATDGLARLALARCEAGQVAEARARVTELHAQLWDPALDDGANAHALAAVGAVHECLGEHAAARGCYAAALAQLGSKRGVVGGLHAELTARSVVALARTRDLDGLREMLRVERAAALPSGVPTSDDGRRWVQQVRAALEAEALTATSAGASGAQAARELREAAARLDAPPPRSAPVEPMRTAGVSVAVGPSPHTIVAPPPAVVELGPTPVERAAQDPMSLAAPWLAPIAGTSPVGADTTNDERYAAVVAAIAEHDSPATPDGARSRAWERVYQAGAELLAEATKDLTLAAYVAHAMARREGGVGLVRGLALLLGLVERYWAEMFPDVKRTKRRANALAWYLERTADAVDAAPLRLDEAPAIERALVLVESLARATRERLGDATPPFAPLRDALRRRALDLSPP